MKDDPEAQAVLQRALVYVGRYSSTRWEVRRWLRRKGVSDEVIRYVVRYCKKRHYINDAEALKGRVRAGIRKKWGRMRVLADLRRRGVPAGTAERAVNRWYPEEREPRIMARWIQTLPKGLKHSVFVRRARSRGFSSHHSLVGWEYYESDWRSDPRNVP